MDDVLMTFQRIESNKEMWNTGTRRGLKKLAFIFIKIYPKKTSHQHDKIWLENFPPSLLDECVPALWYFSKMFSRTTWENIFSHPRSLIFKPPLGPLMRVFFQNRFFCRHIQHNLDEKKRSTSTFVENNFSFFPTLTRHKIFVEKFILSSRKWVRRVEGGHPMKRNRKLCKAFVNRNHYQPSANRRAFNGNPPPTFFYIGFKSSELGRSERELKRANYSYYDEWTG